MVVTLGGVEVVGRCAGAREIGIAGDLEGTYQEQRVTER
jgi:hypothetical protein